MLYESIQRPPCLKYPQLDIVLVLESGPEHLIGEPNSEISLIRAKKGIVFEAI